MARSIEVTGKSVDEAIFNGLNQLEVSIDEVEIEILQHESKGILGIGAKPARVRLTEREPEDVVTPEYLNPEYQEKERRERREKRDRRDNRDNRDNRERRDRRESREKKQATEIREVHIVDESAQPGEIAEVTITAEYEKQPQRRERRRGNRQRRENEQKYTAKEPPEGFTAEAAQGNPAAEFLQGLLDRMGVPGVVLAKIEEDIVRLYIDKSTMGMIIGRRGENLDAMQYLTSLAVNRNRKQEGYTRISIDTEGYREKREETLARLAHKIAAQVKETGRPRTLEPMNPYERRVMHATLQDDPYVATRSEGDEPNRRVIIYPREQE